MPTRKRAPKQTPEDAGEYRFLGRIVEGTEDRRPLGNDNLAMHIGQVVTVVEHVAADEQGAHDDTSDAVVVEWGQGESNRRTAIATDDFGTWFEKA